MHVINQSTFGSLGGQWEKYTSDVRTSQESTVLCRDKNVGFRHSGESEHCKLESRRREAMRGSVYVHSLILHCDTSAKWSSEGGHHLHQVRAPSSPYEAHCTHLNLFPSTTSSETSPPLPSSADFLSNIINWGTTLITQRRRRASRGVLRRTTKGYHHLWTAGRFHLRSATRIYTVIMACWTVVFSSLVLAGVVTVVAQGCTEGRFLS